VFGRHREVLNGRQSTLRIHGTAELGNGFEAAILSNPPMDTKNTCRRVPTLAAVQIMRATILSWSLRSDYLIRVCLGKTEAYGGAALDGYGAGGAGRQESVAVFNMAGPC